MTLFFTRFSILITITFAMYSNLVRIITIRKSFCAISNLMFTTIQYINNPHRKSVIRFAFYFLDINFQVFNSPFVVNRVTTSIFYRHSSHHLINFSAAGGLLAKLRLLSLYSLMGMRIVPIVIPLPPEPKLKINFKKSRTHKSEKNRVTVTNSKRNQKIFEIFLYM